MYVCTFDPLCGILLDDFSGPMEAGCRDDGHGSVYLTEEFAKHTHTVFLSYGFLMNMYGVWNMLKCSHAESDSAVCDDFIELGDDTDRVLLILSRGASMGGHMSKNTSCS